MDAARLQFAGLYAFTNVSQHKMSHLGWDTGCFLCFLFYFFLINVVVKISDVCSLLTFPIKNSDFNLCRII